MFELDIAIEAQGLSKSYGSRPVLRSVSFAIRRGESVGLVGGRGAGKSTLVKLLLGFLSPSAGHVWVFPGRHRSRSDAGIGYAPQQFRLPRSLNAAEFLRYCGGMSGMSAKDGGQRVPEVLAEVGLGDAAGQPMRLLSALEARLVAVAQAAVAAPGLLMLDGITAGLDGGAAQKVLGALDRVRAEGQTLLLTARSAAELEGRCERFYRLDAGDLQEMLPAEAIRVELRAARERIRVVLDAAPAPELAEALSRMGCRVDGDGVTCWLEDTSLDVEQDVLISILQANHRIVELRRELVPSSEAEVRS